MTVAATLSAALISLRAGRAHEARRAAEEVWQQTSDARAAGFLAMIEIKAGNYESALAWNNRARQRKPLDPTYAAQGARVVGLMGDYASAFDRLVAVQREAPHYSGAWTDFPTAAQGCGRIPEAIELCIRAVDSDPSLDFALNALLHLTSDEPEGETITWRAAACPKHSPISVVTCSNNDMRFSAMATSYGRALIDWPHEIIRIPDARSLAEGYTRGADSAKGEIVIFSHDDVDLLAPNFALRLVRHLAACDLLGVAGATRATGPAWSFAGWPFLHGTVIYPEGSGYRVCVYSRNAPLVDGIRVMDGVFLAMRRDIALRVGWDAETCDGFHCYDVDFTLRAAKGGLRLAVATDLGIVHHSGGRFDDIWMVAAHKLVKRHPELNNPAARETGPVARIVPSARHAMALVDNWARVGQSERA